MGQLEFEAKWKKRFERFAHGSTEAAIAGWSESGLAARVRFFNTYCHLPKGCWLDIGCGAGTYCRILQERSIDVIGLDYSFPSLQKAKNHLNTVPWVAADVYQLPIKHESVKGILCFGVLQALENDSELCSSLRSVLKSGSELWLDGLNRWCLWHLWDTFKRKLFNRDKHLHYSNPWRIKRLLRQQGFESIMIYWAPILPKSLSGLQRLVLHPWMQSLYRWMPWGILLFSHAFYVHAKLTNKPLDSLGKV